MLILAQLDPADTQHPTYDKRIPPLYGELTFVQHGTGKEVAKEDTIKGGKAVPGLRFSSCTVKLRAGSWPSGLPLQVCLTQHLQDYSRTHEGTEGLHAGCFCLFNLDVRHLGGHLEITLRLESQGWHTGYPCQRSHFQGHYGRSLPLGVPSPQTWSCGLFFLVFIRVNGAALSVSALRSFRSCVARAVWSKSFT